jgi:hypothetical protein
VLGTTLLAESGRHSSILLFQLLLRQLQLSCCLSFSCKEGQAPDEWTMLGSTAQGRAPQHHSLTATPSAMMSPVPSPNLHHSQRQRQHM